MEVLIFASDTPISVKQIQGVMEEARPKEIEKAVDALNDEYKKTGRTFLIVQVAGGYQMVSRDSYSQWIRKLFHRKIKARLSQAALEALSVIAFKQPVSKPEIEAVRGVNCDGVVRTLLERKLITLSGRGEGPGKPLLYKTTDEFLRYFGINQLSDLPKPREIEEILKEEKQPDEVEGVDALKSPDAAASEEKQSETGGNEKREEAEETGQNSKGKRGRKKTEGAEASGVENETSSTDEPNKEAKGKTSETVEVNDATE